MCNEEKLTPRRNQEETTLTRAKEIDRLGREPTTNSNLTDNQVKQPADIDIHLTLKESRESPSHQDFNSKPLLEQSRTHTLVK